MAVSTVLILMVLVSWSATTIARADVGRLHADESLTKSETRFQAIIEHSADAIALIASDAAFLYRSPAAARVLGVHPAALLDPSYETIIHPDDRDQLRQTFEKVRDTPRSRSAVEFRFRHGDGTWHWSEGTMTNMLHDPNVNAIVANYRDATEQRQTIHALRDSEQRFREIAEYIGEAFFVVEIVKFKALYISPNWAAIWDRPIQEGYDWNIWLAAFHPDEGEAIQTWLRRVREGRSTNDVFRIVRPDETFRWVHMRMFPVTATDGNVYRMVGVATDITSLRQAEERFAQAQKMEAMGRLAGGVAHDFNNLLTVILGETELLQRDLPKEGEQAEMLQDIRHAADSAATLTRQLLAFSRKQLVAPTVFDINTAIVETSKMLRRLIGENVRLETRLAPDAGVVRLDRGQLEQVLTNLAVNARDAMPSGGLLVVETTPVTLDADYAALYPEVQPGNYTLIAVNDTGGGMTPEVRANIFDPFFTTKERGKGTGLGLAMIHGIVKQAGGHIAVYSELGVGTTFRIYFPRVVEKQPVLRPRIEPKSLPRGSEMVLLVEDEEMVRRVATRMLGALGYTVLEARDAREAEEILERRGFEIKLLFTDVVLPGMHGRELAERVKSRFPAIRVLFTSGYSDDVVLQHRLLAENVVVLEKPYNRDTLAAKIRQALDA
jgi:PAS domain S-box-containing protein